MAPLFPTVAEPEPTYTEPLSPDDAVPVLTTIKPLTPVVPALNVLSSNAPLLEADPLPLTKLTRPPVPPLDLPPDRTNSPPEPLLPDPTVTYMEPPRP